MSRLGENADSVQWFKSSYSSNSVGCVEVAMADGHTSVRDSKNPSAGHLAFDYEQWRSFLAIINAL